jgi:hypothetical protein
VCSSDFVGENWTKLLYGYGDLANGYSQLDRPILSKHFQLLGWYCSRIQRYLESGLNSLYKKTLLSSSVISRSTFNTRANQTIRTYFEGAKVNFKYGTERLGMLYRGNLIANAFNADWMIEYGNELNSYLLRGVPRMFGNGSCNCVLSDECQRPLRIGPPDLVLPGLVVGCSPFYTISLSSLECLFSSECIETILNHLHYYTTINGSEPSNFKPPTIPPLMFTPLMVSKLLRFPSTALLGTILDETLLEQLRYTISYEKYFATCSPKRCSYEYVKSDDALHVLTVLLGLYGGLTISLRFILWNMSRIYHKIKRYLHTRTTAVEPFIVSSIAH